MQASYLQQEKKQQLQDKINIQGEQRVGVKGGCSVSPSEGSLSAWQERGSQGKNHTDTFNTQEGNQGDMKGTETKEWFANGFLEVESVWEREQLVDELKEGKGSTAW